MLGLFLFVSTLLFCLSNQYVNCQAQQEQYVSVYSTNGCTGNPLWNSPSITPSFNLTGQPNPISTVYIRVNGLWTIEPCNEATCQNQTIRASSSGLDCTQQSIDTGMDRIRFSRKGDPNQVAKEIYLFTEENLQGSDYVVNESGRNNLNIVARSFFFTGPNSWLINNETCLNHTIGTNSFGFTYEAIQNIQITSISYTCNWMPTPTTSAPTVTTTGPIVTTSIKPCNQTANECSNGFRFSLNSIHYIIIVFVFKLN